MIEYVYVMHVRSKICNLQASSQEAALCSDRLLCSTGM